MSWKLVGFPSGVFPVARRNISQLTVILPRENKPAPQIAIEYWRLPKDAKSVASFRFARNMHYH